MACGAGLAVCCRSRARCASGIAGRAVGVGGVRACDEIEASCARARKAGVADPGVGVFPIGAAGLHGAVSVQLHKLARVALGHAKGARAVHVGVVVVVAGCAHVREYEKETAKKQ